MSEIQSIVDLQYDAAFYAARTPADKAEYRAIAQTIFDLFHPDTVLDMGCGPGEKITHLASLGVVVHGVDGSRFAFEAADPSIQPRFLVADLTECGWLARAVGKVDLTMCFETAEHVPRALADRFVHTVAANVHQTLLFSAAYPGQGGHCHFNEQPIDYWIGRFTSAGLRLDGERTSELRRALEKAAPLQAYYGKTAIVMKVA